MTQVYTRVYTDWEVVAVGAVSNLHWKNIGIPNVQGNIRKCEGKSTV